MTKSIFILVLFLTVYRTTAQPPNLNLDAEQVADITKLPDGWIKWGRGYKLRSDTTIRYSGNYSIFIEAPAGRGSEDFGCAAYRIPAVYAGNSITLTGWLKLENVADGQIGLLMRIDGNTGVLQFDNMSGKDINGTADWKEYSITLPYPKDAKTIYVGAILNGTGKLWADDFRLTIDGKDISEADIKVVKKFKADQDNEFDKGSGLVLSSLSTGKINDLKMLGLVWGFLKYYHPAVAKGDHNWDYELFRIAPLILKASDAAARDKVLLDWINSLGTFVEVLHTS